MTNQIRPQAEASAIAMRLMNSLPSPLHAGMFGAGAGALVALLKDKSLLKYAFLYGSGAFVIMFVADSFFAVGTVAGCGACVAREGEARGVGFANTDSFST
jgi:hypothetical protein